MMKPVFPNYIHLKESRVKELCVNEAPAYHVGTRAVDIEHLDPEDEAVLIELLLRWNKQVNVFVQKFESSEWRLFVIGNGYRKLRDALVAGENPTSYFGLQGRHWKVGLQFASSVQSNRWRLAQTNALKSIKKGSRWVALCKDAQKFVRRMLNSLSIDFFDLMDEKTPNLSDREKGIPDIEKLCAWVRHKVQDCLGKIPEVSPTLIRFDSDSFKLEEEDGRQYLSLMSLTPGKRIKLPILGYVPARKVDGKNKLSTISVIKSHGTLKVEFQYSLKKPDGSLRIKPLLLPDAYRLKDGFAVTRAVDLGLTEPLTTNDGIRFGAHESRLDLGKRSNGRTLEIPGLGELIERYAQYLDRKQAERNRFEAMVRDPDTDKKKKKRIKKNNLGSKRYEAEIRRLKAAIVCCINRAINNLFARCPANVYVLECLSEVFDLKGISKKVRRKLSMWCRGIIRERMYYKAAKRGIRIVEVAAAYSSQQCPICGHVDRNNRHGDKFHCKACGYIGDADQVGALNCLKRAESPKYERFMSTEQVRKLCREEYLSYCKAHNLEPLPEARPKPKTKPRSRPRC